MFRKLLYGSIFNHNGGICTHLTNIHITNRAVKYERNYNT